MPSLWDFRCAPRLPTNNARPAGPRRWRSHFRAPPVPHFPISRFPIFHHVLRLSTVVAAASVFAGAAFAQLAPQRTWPELKEAVQQRADRNAYPMTGMKAEDVREILGNIASLDRDE